MRDAFNLVRGAVSKKDLVPVLTHFAVHEGRIHGYNGRIHISAPCTELAPLPSFTVPARLLLAAIDACAGEPVLTTDDNAAAVDKVVVSDTDSPFMATLPTGPIDQFPIPPAPDKGKRLGANTLLELLRALHPFIGDDASRPWCASIRFHNAMAMATNNVALATMPLPKWMPLASFALPVFAVEELLRIGQEPKSMAFDGQHALWFGLPGQVQIRTSLIADDLWPDALGVLKTAQEGAHYQSVDPRLGQAVQHCVPFCPDPHNPAIVLDDYQVRTQEGVSTACVAGFAGLAGTYHAIPLQLVLGAATAVAWDKAPRVPWQGEAGLAGVLMALAG